MLSQRRPSTILIFQTGIMSSMRTRRPSAQRSAHRKSSRSTVAMRQSKIPATAPSTTSMAQRRSILRRQRGMRSLKILWRLLLAGGLAGGLVWGMGQPIWLVRSADQVQIKGNRAMAADSLREMVPIDYPQSLLKIQPDVLEAALLDQAPLLDAKVSRRIVPPSLVIKVWERQPVALAELARPQAAAKQTSGASPILAPSTGAAASGTAAPAPAFGDPPGEGTLSQTETVKVAAKTPPPSERVLLDASGEWVSLDRYDNPESFLELPSLKVYGMRPEYKQDWQLLYRALSQSPVVVQEVDWQEPANLKLLTDMGRVHLGPYGPQFAYQLEILDRMRNLPSYAEAEDIAFIDLRTPDVPRLQMKTEQLAAERNP